MTNPRPDTPRRRWDHQLFRVESALVSAFLAATLVLVLLQVTARSLFDQPLPWSDEASRLCLVWLTFVGAGALMAHGRHLAVDALMHVLPRRIGMAVEVVSNIVVAAVCACVLVAGAGFVAVVARSVSPALAVSTGWFYGAALTGMVLVILHAVVNSVDALRAGEPRYASAAEEAAEDVVALEGAADRDADRDADGTSEAGGVRTHPAGSNEMETR